MRDMKTKAANGHLADELAALEKRNTELSRTLSDFRVRDALKTRFLSNISHDLRTPLSAMITHAEILRDGLLGELSERQQASVEGIINGGRQLLTMVNEILLYAKGSANQLNVSLTEFDFPPLVEQVHKLNVSLLAKKELQFEKRVQADLPRLRADRDKIAHVIGNLLGNAIAFTPAGGRVWIGAAFAGAELVVEVGDTGIGIAPENHELVFREFAQVDSSAAREHHGTGLGLTIARQLVELHGGRMWVESALGNGSRFFFSVPDRHLVGPGGRNGRLNDADARRRKVLIVEDSTLVTDALKVLLEGHGYAVTVAHTASAAREAARTNDMDAVLLDIGLPDEDGLALAREWTTQNRPVVLALTGYGDEETIARSRAAGCRAVLVKPVASAELLRQLEALIPNP